MDIQKQKKSAFHRSIVNDNRRKSFHNKNKYNINIVIKIFIHIKISSLTHVTTNCSTVSVFLGLNSCIRNAKPGNCLGRTY